MTEDSVSPFSPLTSFLKPPASTWSCALSAVPTALLRLIQLGDHGLLVLQDQVAIDDILKFAEVPGPAVLDKALPARQEKSAAAARSYFLAPLRMK